MKKENVQMFIRKRAGQGIVEYVLIIALIAVVVVVALGTLGNTAKNKLENISTEIE